MNSLVKSLIVAGVMFSTCTVEAQTLSTRQKWEANTCILESIQKYETNLDIHDNFAERDFRSLFQSDDILVYCDILDYKCGERIPLDEYIDELSKRENISYELMDLMLSDPELRDDGWHITASFSKTMLYTRGSVIFSSSEYFDNTYDLKADFLYDEESRSCKIVSLDGTNRSRRAPLEEHFIVVQHNDAKYNPKAAKLDDKLSSHGRKLSFNSFGQAFADREIRSNDEDMIIVTDILEHYPDFDYVTMKYKSTHWRIRPYAGLAFGGPYKFTTTMHNDNTSSGYEAGVDVGYMFPLGNGFHAGLFVGGAVSNSSISFSYDDPVSYSLTAYDENGHGTERMYAIDSMTESVEYSHIVIPAYLSVTRSFGGGFSAELCAGVKYYNVIGIGPGGYKISGKINNNGFETYYRKFFNARSYKPEPLDLSLKFGFGVSYPLVKKLMYINMRVEYESGITDFHKSDNNKLFDQTDGDYPLVYSSVYNEDIATRSFLDCVTIRRNALWGQVGFTVKF